MEICYYWIDRYSTVIKEQGYDFGSQLTFEFNYQQKELFIKEHELYVKGFFNFNNGRKIKNVTAIAGRNGVGKSTFIQALKGLLIDGGILATQISDEQIYYYKRILVIKLEEKYKVIYHKDLISLTDGLPNIIYENSEIENRYEIEFISYGAGDNIHLLKNELFRIKGTEDLSYTSCIYFSHAFDNNFYSDLSREDRKYFDISTKGLLNKIEEDFRPSNTFSTTEPNHLINKDSRFNVGILKEFYITENKKRIELLSDDVGKKIIESHSFFPEKVYLNLDYIIYKQDNFSFLDINPRELLRVEKNKSNLNKIEKYILNFIENIHESKLNGSTDNSFLLAKQTYLRRIFDSFFEDVDRFIFFNSRKINIFEFFESINDEELMKKDLLELLDLFLELTIKCLRNVSKTDGLEKTFNEEQFKTLTQSYKDFVIFFNDTLLTESSIVDVLKGTIDFVTTDSNETQAVGLRDIGIIEIKLNSEGVQILKQFINHYENIDTVSNFIKFQWGGISTGEDTLLTIYSRFFELKSLDVGKNTIILLDEIEHSLHPEWQRRILNNLIEYLPYVFSDCDSIQIVLATNVPFLIADIPTKNVVYLEKSEEVLKGKVKISTKPELFNQTFAANIHSLLINNFFMESTIGEFSARKIQEMIKILKSVSTDEHYYSSQEIYNIIHTIGEPIIRNKLESMYHKKYGENLEQANLNRLIKEFKEEKNYSPEKVDALLNAILLKSGKESKDD
ncbi:TPA: AAA family ATPase [Bacillus wiedmannii]